MTKGERLIYITNVINNRGPIIGGQLAAECGVTTRTIYRDLRSLETLNVPIYYDQGKGYRLAMKTELIYGQINNNDAELILFCLYNNPLSKSPFFKQRLMYLKEKLQSQFEKKIRFKKDSNLVYDTSFKGLDEKHFEIVLKFLLAVFQKYKVTLIENTSLANMEPMVPIGIRFKNKGATLILYDELKKTDCRIDIEDLYGICILPSKFVDRPSVSREKYRINQETLSN